MGSYRVESKPFWTRLLQIKQEAHRLGEALLESASNMREQLGIHWTMLLGAVACVVIVWVWCHPKRVDAWTLHVKDSAEKVHLSDPEDSSGDEGVERVMRVPFSQRQFVDPYTNREDEDLRSTRYRHSSEPDLRGWKTTEQK